MPAIRMVLRNACSSSVVRAILQKQGHSVVSGAEQGPRNRMKRRQYVTYQSSFGSGGATAKVDPH